MVYQGPSKGCRTCRTRRVKCDETRPSCQNCVRRNQPCPGYSDDFDIRHKDQTASTSDNALRSSRARGKRPAKRESLSPPTRSLQQDNETACLCFYFTNYVAIKRDPLSTLGFHQFLLPMYSRVDHNSPLSLATSALSSNFALAWSGQGLEGLLARTFFGRALALTKTAIEDPQQNTTDELLLTVLMLEHYEDVTDASRSTSSSGAHRSGAVALCKHRGSLNYRSDTSKQLLQSVRHQLIQKALETGEQISPDPALWNNDQMDMPETPATMLDGLIYGLVGLKAVANTIDFPTRPNTPILITEESSPSDFEASETAITILHSILAPALHLDSELLSWAKNLPLYWHPIPISTPLIHPTIVSAGCYGTYCDIYPSLSIAGLWNQWRSTRIAVFKIILKCQRSLIHLSRPSSPEPTSSTHDPAPTESYALSGIQSLVDGFCASIPAHLGNRTGPASLLTFTGVEYPCLPSTTISSEMSTFPLLPHTIGYPSQLSREEYVRIATSSGGWYLLGPARNILRDCNSFNEKDEEAPLLRDGQMKWITGQLGRLKRIHGIRESSGGDR